MLILSSTTDKIELVTSSAADIDYVVCYSKMNLAAAPVIDDAQPLDGTIAAAQTTNLTGSPAASTDRWAIVSIELRNRHATTANDLTLRHVKAGGTGRELIKVTLAAGEKLVRSKDGVWFVYDATGGVRAGGTAATTSQAGIVQLADQTTMESAASLVTAVAPGNQHFHPSAAKAWVVAGVTGNILASYNITSLTDTGTGDIAVTINVDFSSANYTVVMAVQRINSTAAEANSRIGTLKTASLVAGSFSMDCWDGTATTNVIKDPTTWHAACFGDQ